MFSFYMQPSCVEVQVKGIRDMCGRQDKVDANWFGCFLVSQKGGHEANESVRCE